MKIEIDDTRKNTGPTDATWFNEGDLVLGKLYEIATMCVVGYTNSSVKVFVELLTGKIHDRGIVMYDWQICENTQLTVKI